MGVNGTKDGGRGNENNKVYCNRPEQCTSVTPQQPAGGHLKPVHLQGYLEGHILKKHEDPKQSEKVFNIEAFLIKRKAHWDESLVAVHRETSESEPLGLLPDDELP